MAPMCPLHLAAGEIRSLTANLSCSRRGPLLSQAVPIPLRRQLPQEPATPKPDKGFWCHL